MIRPAARVVVLEPDGAVLLQRIATTEGWDGWITPGGAVEAGETHVDAARRELIEEVGLTDVVLGPPIWTRRHVFPWNGVVYDQRETYYLVRLDRRIEPRPAVGAEVLASEGVLEHRWWALDDLASVQTAPRGLASLVRRLLDDGPPAQPIDAGV